ncbi:MAG: diphthine--ammonia ligase [Thermoprotei archaeon]|nr:MAG: diphthine--ammonia ligase [Thermoprotei archaeon]
MRVCVLYSGGKDSNLALLKASEEHEVACLVTLRPRSEESRLFHYPNVHLVRLQAEALQLPLIEEPAPDDEEGGLAALRRALTRAKRIYGIEGVVTGAIRSSYQASRFESVCRELGLECINPLWMRDDVSVLREVVERGFHVIFTRVAGYPLKKTLLGRRIDMEVVRMLESLRRYLNPSGEGGEYETLVLDMPLFRKRLVLLKWRVEGVDYDATLIVEEAALVEKRSG